MNTGPLTCGYDFPYKEDVGGSIPSAPTYQFTLKRSGSMTLQQDSSEVGAAGERQDVPRERTKQYMDNPPAVGAPKNSPWGYLPCGCTNDGYGNHVR